MTKTNKRKRSRSKDATASPDAQLMRRATNPFLPAREDAALRKEDDLLLQNVTAFAARSTKSKSSTSGGTGTQRSGDSTDRDIVYLVEYLIDDEATAPSASFAPTDIALLLLPWGLQQVQQNSVQDLVWKTLSISLSVLQKDASCSAALQKLLSQSVLFKIVPKVALLAAAVARDDNGVEVADHVATYTILLNLFHPAMDVACKAVLLPLLDTATICTKFANDRRILLATLRWILTIHLSRKGNPKTTFQLLAESKVLTALSRCHALFESTSDATVSREGQTVVRDILWDGLFHPRHHLEGFITLLTKSSVNSKHSAQDNKSATPAPPLNDADDPTEGQDASTKKPAFKSYHEELMDTIAECLSDASGSSNGGGDDDDGDRTAVVRILPVLLRGFFQQSGDRDRREREAKTSAGRARNADSVALAQFQLFLRWARPLLGRVGSSSTDAAAPALRALRHLLELLLEFDAHAPSQQDPEGGDQYSFLQSIASRILAIPTMNDSANRLLLIPDSIRCLRLLLQLHHLLLHDSIVEAVSLCLHGCDETLFSLIADFVSTMVDTYRLLRQQRYIFASILGVVRKSKEAKAFGEIAFLHSLLEDPKLAGSIAVAVEASPIVEVKEVFQTTSSWIVDLCKSTKLDGMGDRTSLDVAVRLSSIATRNVRVDRGTSSDVAAVCQDFMNGSVRILAERGGSNRDSMCASLMLCGLVLDLYTRCVFWLGRNEELCVPLQISDTLKATAGGAMPSSSSEPLLDGVIFLSCHRLKQLHSLIHDLEREEMGQSLVGGKITALTAEATNLAAFIANETEQSSQRRGHQWIAVAHNFSSWIAYANQHDINQFLRWVVSASTQSVSPLSLSKVKLLEQSDGSSGNDLSRQSGEQGEVAKCLLGDSSFFQYAEVASRITLVGLSVAADCVLAALDFSNTGICSAELRRLVSSPLENDAWRRSRHSEILQLVNNDSEIYSKASADATPLLESALRSILVINGLPCFDGLEDDALNFLDLTWRVDHVCRSLCIANRQLFPTAVSIVSALRLSLVKMLCSSHGRAMQSFLCLIANIGEIACGIMSSAIRLVAAHDSPDSMESQQLISATGQLVERLLAGATSSSMDEGTAKTLSTSFSRLMIAARSTLEIRALVVLSRHLLEGLRFSEWPSLYPVEGDVRTHLAAVFETIWDLALTSNESLHFDSSEELVPKIPIDSVTFLEGLLLLGDLLRSKDVAWLLLSSQALNEMQQRCIEYLRRSKTEPVTERSLNAVCYLVGRLTQVRPTNELTGSIVDALVSSTPMACSASLLEASFCHATPGLRGDDLQSVLVKLTTYLEQVESPSSVRPRLRLVNLLLRYLDEEHQVESVSSYGRKIFALALRPMHGNLGELLWTENIVSASNLLEHLVKRRDILALKERDLALILSYIIGVLGPSGNASVTENREGANSLGDDGGTSVYTCTADLLSTMFQRYTKQLYTCVPSVISALQCFLRHAMFAPLLLSDQSIALRGQRFTRLCELLVGHREIYKKHVIGLVLEFVGGLGQSMSLQRRDSLVPAIYCLLDTMSTFEMQQLNAYMDTKAKIIFRTIHQSYQKLHTYNGQ